jgi:hypothetical protein
MGCLNRCGNHAARSAVLAHADEQHGQAATFRKWGEKMAGLAEPIVKACKRNYEQDKDDCSAFVRDVAASLGIQLVGNADAIVDYMTAHWTQIPTGIQANGWASTGCFVVAGLRSSDHAGHRAHGHVAILAGSGVDAGQYPYLWGGSIGSAQSQGGKSVNGVWGPADRDHVKYFMSPYVGVVVAAKSSPIPIVP